MKKQLLFAGLLFGSVFSVNAQLLQSENFNSLTIGNVGTDLTGATAGQGGLFTFSDAGGTNGANSNYQIVADNATQGNVLQIIGSNAATGNRFVWKNGLDASWTSRTSGNNVIELEFSFFSGAATTSKSVLRPLIFTADGTVIGGFNFNMSTKKLDGFAYGDFNQTGTPGNYTISLATGGLSVPANTWIRVGFAYDSTTGTFTWVSNDLDVGGTIDGAPGYVPAEFDVVVIAGTANTVASTFRFDDFTVRATAVENLLSTNKVEANKFSVYPNPSNGLVNISNDLNSTLSSVSFSDLNGRTIKTVKLNGDSSAQVNISELAAGVYMMNISSDQGTITKKIIKN
ncbi:T9SS type A sorting domain-containing protein [Flavobacterium sp. 28YEA47A]|uniref:T9SS type A sorting domain-containing protein n=1 Tax=Flavobacterium sp. 28YEA47A TaxID=3156276 RepID=UPI00351423E0